MTVRHFTERPPARRSCEAPTSGSRRTKLAKLRTRRSGRRRTNPGHPDRSVTRAAAAAGYEFKQALLDRVLEVEDAGNAFGRAVKRIADGTAPEAGVPEAQAVRERAWKWTTAGAVKVRAAAPAQLAYCGAPTADQAATSGMRRADLMPPDRLLADGNKVDVPGWRLTAVWTPGHTPGHTCYRIEDSGLLFSGDHALPTISSRVGVAEYDGASDALGDMLVSLERAAKLDTSAAWPGHEFEFGAGQYRDRCHELVTRQQEQLRQTARVLENGPATAWTVAEALGRERSFEALEPIRRRLIVLEVLARLQHLQATGAAGLRVCDGTAVFSLTERPTG